MPWCLPAPIPRKNDDTGIFSLPDGHVEWLCHIYMMPVVTGKVTRQSMTLRSAEMSSFFVKIVFALFAQPLAFFQEEVQ